MSLSMKRIARYFGLNRDEIIGKRFLPDIPPEDRERVRQFFASLTPDHPIDSIEHRIIMKDGTVTVAAVERPCDLRSFRIGY